MRLSLLYPKAFVVLVSDHKGDSIIPVFSDQIFIAYVSKLGGLTQAEVEYVAKSYNLLTALKQLTRYEGNGGPWVVDARDAEQFVKGANDTIKWMDQAEHLLDRGGARSARTEKPVAGSTQGTSEP